jgi:hypothetical protein
MLSTVFDYGMTGDEVQHRYARRCALVRHRRG